MKVAAQLKFSALAHEDLLGARYIARNNPSRARIFVNELRQQCVLLSQQPGLGAARADLSENLRAPLPAICNFLFQDWFWHLG